MLEIAKNPHIIIVMQYVKLINAKDLFLKPLWMCLCKNVLTPPKIVRIANIIENCAVGTSNESVSIVSLNEKVEYAIPSKNNINNTSAWILFDLIISLNSFNNDSCFSCFLCFLNESVLKHDESVVAITWKINVIIIGRYGLIRNVTPVKNAVTPSNNS